MMHCRTRLESVAEVISLNLQQLSFYGDLSMVVT